MHSEILVLFILKTTDCKKDYTNKENKRTSDLTFMVYFKCKNLSQKGKLVSLPLKGIKLLVM